MRASEIATVAREELKSLTGLETETVSSVQKQGDHWDVTVDVIELRMTPNSRDVIAVYDVQVDPEGGVMGYRRMGRYVRSQVEIISV